MRLFLPVESDAGMASRLSGHFGHAPYFAVIDGAAEAAGLTFQPGAEAGACGGWRKLDIAPGDLVICRHIGSGAFEALTRAGVRILFTEADNLHQALASYCEGELEELHSGQVHACHHHH